MPVSSAELAFEYLCAAQEAYATRGTPVDPPTHYLDLQGTLTPVQDVVTPKYARGNLAEYSKAFATRQRSELNASGPLDVYTLPLLLETCVKGGGTIATPGGGTNSRTHTYVPDWDADDLRAMTLYGGLDPLVQAFQVSYAQVDELVLSGSGDSTEAATMAVKATGRFFAKDAPNSLPTPKYGPMIAPTNTTLTIDTSAAIGTTGVTGRLVSWEIKIPSGLTRKWLGNGPASGKAFYGVGRALRHAELKLQMEVPDLTQYDQWAALTELKVRFVASGPLIEGALYHYVQFDIYGPFAAMEWSEAFGSNRTIGLTVMSMDCSYAVTAGHDFQVVVQNDLATL